MPQTGERLKVLIDRHLCHFGHETLKMGKPSRTKPWTSNDWYDDDDDEYYGL